MKMDGEVILREADERDLNAVYEYRAEFLICGDSMDGTSCLRDYEDMRAWLGFVRCSAGEETCRADWVPDTQYLIVRAADGRLVGMLDIRDRLNEDCLKYYGHIGYSIRPSERRKGYASAALRLALGICREKGMKRVLVTCVRGNAASERIILRCGGILENELFDPNDGTVTRRYWIDV